MREFTDEEVLNRVEEIGGQIIKNQLLLVAIRSNADNPNVFDDKVFLYEGRNFQMGTSCTTNPGRNALLDFATKGNKAGAAVLKADEFYLDGLTFGFHKGKMPCLKPAIPFKYYRDNDGDLKSEAIGEVHEGMIGTNFHGVDYDFESNKVSTKINGWSFGCIVANVMKIYRAMISICRKHPKKINFALLQEF